MQPSQSPRPLAALGVSAPRPLLSEPLAWPGFLSLISAPAFALNVSRVTFNVEVKRKCLGAAFQGAFVGSGAAERLGCSFVPSALPLPGCCHGQAHTLCACVLSLSVYEHADGLVQVYMNVCLKSLEQCLAGGRLP